MRLLLCDDHLLFVEPLGAVFTGQGHDVTVATDAAEALALVRTRDFDVSILDLHLQGDDGIELGRRIREVQPGCRVLILSSSSDPRAVQRAVESGADGFARKDQLFSAIAEGVARVARGEMVFERGAAHPAAPPRAHTVADLLAFLTPREREVLGELLDARGTSEIARRLCIAPSTARTHVQNVLEKMGVHSRLQVVALIVGAGLDEELRPGVRRARA